MTPHTSTPTGGGPQNQGLHVHLGRGPRDRRGRADPGSVPAAGWRWPGSGAGGWGVGHRRAGCLVPSAGCPARRSSTLGSSSCTLRCPHPPTPTHIAPSSAVRCEALDIGYIDGMLLLPLIIEHTIGAAACLLAARTPGWLRRGGPRAPPARLPRCPCPARPSSPPPTPNSKTPRRRAVAAMRAHVRFADGAQRRNCGDVRGHHRGACLLRAALFLPLSSCVWPAAGGAALSWVAHYGGRRPLHPTPQLRLYPCLPTPARSLAIPS